jgi:eukaryotic-like serine/threonine-protein kinase
MTGEELGRIFEGKILQGRYHLKKLLAAGAFGAVFHAEHRILGRTVREVAVKITTHTDLTSANVEKVFGEAIVSARVYDRLEGSGATKYLIPVYDMGILSDYEGRGFIVMGLVRGKRSEPEHCIPPETLAEKVRNWAETGMVSAMEYMSRVCEAVAALHEQNVIHRDLKPDNILLSESGQIRLADLGLAAELDASGYAQGNVGTLQYMAPETGLEGRSSPASDVYSLGLMAYELLAGQSPFKHLIEEELPKQNLPEELKNVWLQREKASAQIMPPSVYGRRVEHWEDRLVLRCLSAMDYARPQSAAELGKLIESAGMEEGPHINGSGWAEWFDGERNWPAEASMLESFLGKWRNRRRDSIWFEAATKLALCYLSMAQTDMQSFEALLRDAEELIRGGVVILNYQDRAAWYGGLASVMERRSRAGLLKSEYRDKEMEARSRLLNQRR